MTLAPAATTVLTVGGIERTPAQGPLHEMTSLRQQYKTIAALPINHPARKLLDGISLCQSECAGREIHWKGHENEAVDQGWYSETHGYYWQFSDFVYKYVVYRCERLLDAWLKALPEQSEDEVQMTRELPMLRTMLDECALAAEAERNYEIVRMVGLVRSLFEQAEAAISARAALPN